MSNETTQEGVEDKQPTEEQIEAAQKRVEEMQGKADPVRGRLYRRRNEEMTGEQEEEEEEEQETETDDMPDGEGDDKDIETDDDEPAPEKRTRKIKVNGEEMEVDEDEIIEAGIRAKQKETAADARFREVAERERIIQEREQRLREEEERLKSQAVKEEEVDEDVDDDELETIVEQLYSGDEGEGKEALARILKRAKSTNTGMSPDEIQRLIDEKVEQREQARLAETRNQQIDDANTWFSNNYAWVEQDETYNEMAEAKARSLMRANPHISPMDVVEQVGQHMETVLSKVDPGKKKDPLAERRERKRQQADTPTAASGRAPSPPEEKPKSRKEAFSDIARARGQRV